ncbi:hypothetical protein SAM23877_7311 [Streptomyces ambofaciens ATCC 23877]|uniref:Uncharacterized protein n=1 Tax=Streptomyces ambofaciens (strain ATCC 23877 / 3486 / DSM 40053 / JCM 4204 / NBRC 12836 / NRRL B-2516) TaxID=278992 RepID=A0A0K2B4Z8_STRA7|nr:hypothetical protein SAM23877_7311 [Streptomyces ambofaciens ATCC 23877]
MSWPGESYYNFAALVDSRTRLRPIILTCYRRQRN